MDTQALEDLRTEALEDAAPPAGAVPIPEPETAAPVIDPAQEWAGMLGMAVMLLTPALPFLPTIYTEDTLARLGAAIVPVANKYGVTTGGIFEKFGPEIGLAVVAAPLAIRTVQEFRAMRAEQQAEAARAEEARRQAASEEAQPATGFQMAEPVTA